MESMIQHVTRFQEVIHNKDYNYFADIVNQLFGLFNIGIICLVKEMEERRNTRKPPAKYDSRMDSQLRRQLYTLCQRGELTDIKINIGSHYFDCHRAVLAANPGYFRSLFDSGMCETSSSVIVIRHPISYQTFNNVLKFLYLGESNVVSVDNAYEMHLAATYFQIPTIERRASEILQNVKEYKDLENIFLQIIDSPFKTIPQPIIKELALEFRKISEVKNFNELPTHELMKILDSPFLKIKCEVDLINYLCQWAVDHKLQRAEKKELAKRIKWINVIPEDYEPTRYDILINESKKNEYINGHLELTKERLAPPIIAIAMHEREFHKALNILERYSPCPAHVFKLTDDVFQNSIKYHIDIFQFLTPGKTSCFIDQDHHAFTIKMQENYFGAIYAIRLTISKNSGIQRVLFSTLLKNQIAKQPKNAQINGNRLEVQFSYDRPFEEIQVIFSTQGNSCIIDNIEMAGFTFKDS